MNEQEKRESESAKLAPVIKDMFERLGTPMYVDLMYAVALERMVKYKAYIKAGFNEIQALELCKS